MSRRPTGTTRLGAPIITAALACVPMQIAYAQTAEPAVTPVTPAPAPPPAGAESASKGEYDALILRALGAYDAARWDEARELFERAHALDPTARTLRTIGMTAFNQGDYLGALRHLEAALVDARRPLTDDQRTHVLGLIDRSNRQVGRYRVRIAPPGAALSVDGAPPAVLSEDELVILPGRHVLRATALGHRPHERTLEVRGGEREKLDLALEPEGFVPAVSPHPAAAAAPGPLAPAAPAAAPAAPSDSGDVALGVVALSVGGAALIASGVTLAMALSDKSELDDGCPDRVCPPALEDTRSRYQTLRIVSPVALGVGVLSAALGVLLVASGGDPAEAAAHASVVPAGLGVKGAW